MDGPEQWQFSREETPHLCSHSCSPLFSSCFHAPSFEKISASTTLTHLFFYNVQHPLASSSVHPSPTRLYICSCQTPECLHFDYEFHFPTIQPSIPAVSPFTPPSIRFVEPPSTHLHTQTPTCCKAGLSSHFTHGSFYFSWNHRYHADLQLVPKKMDSELMVLEEAFLEKIHSRLIIDHYFQHFFS